MRRPSPRALSLMVTLYGRHPCNRGLMLFPPFCRQWVAIIGLRGLKRVWSFCVQIRDSEFVRMKEAGVEFVGEPQVQPYGTGVTFENLYGNKIYMNQEAK